MTVQELKKVLESWTFKFYKTAPPYTVEFIDDIIKIEGQSIAIYELTKSGPNFYMSFPETSGVVDLYDFKNVWLYVDHDERFPIKINHSLGDRKIILVTDKLR